MLNIIVEKTDSCKLFLQCFPRPDIACSPWIWRSDFLMVFQREKFKNTVIVVVVVKNKIIKRVFFG